MSEASSVASQVMLDCTPSVFWQQFLIYVSPAVSALLSAIALWVASRARGTSKAAQSTSVEVEETLRQAYASLGPNGSLPDALDRRKR